MECDSDWFRLYGAWAHRSLPPQWINAVDRDRIFDSQRVDREPRLAISRPTILEPAWKPHISICRNERPRTNRDLWEKGVALGDMLSRETWLRGQGRKIGSIRKSIKIKQKAWLDLARKRGVPASMAPGARVEFEFSPEARTNGHHWWFSADCPLLMDIREAFGLRREPRVPFHLTFAVLEGSDND